MLRCISYVVFDLPRRTGALFAIEAAAGPGVCPIRRSGRNLTLAFKLLQTACQSSGVVGEATQLCGCAFCGAGHSRNRRSPGCIGLDSRLHWDAGTEQFNGG
tara:strand:- start:3045 stop:3350 length:306 start_codon:yes stop_codon:yes gene_type:complete